MTRPAPVIYSPTAQPFSLALSLCPVHLHLLMAHCPLPPAPAHTRTHTRMSLEGREGPRKKQPRATCSVGEQPLILSQREWACGGISAGLWVAQEDGGQEREGSLDTLPAKEERASTDTDCGGHFGLKNWVTILASDPISMVLV